MEYVMSEEKDGDLLAEIRASAMKPSLEALGRFDEDRVRRRFLETFVPSDTVKLISNDELLGFYVVRNRVDHVYLDHLYVKPEYQSRKIGKTALNKVVSEAHARGLPVRLGALQGSKSNDFYANNGFVYSHEDEYDIYYEHPVNT